MTTLKPLPCPVCGKKPKKEHYLCDPMEWTISCASYRRTCVHDLFARAKTSAKAIERWNRMVSK